MLSYEHEPYEKKTNINSIFDSSLVSGHMHNVDGFIYKL